ncbi:MAG TPA: hypothetical protein VE995_06290, partial [Gaiellaceae bacterium]|nr:hypothetical protein [Gaiellaceae bacterium]
MSVGYPLVLAGRRRGGAAIASIRAGSAPVSVAVLAVGVTLWACALPEVARLVAAARPEWPALGLPAAWWAGAALLVAAAAWQVSARTSRPGLDLLFLAAIVLVLYGTIPAVAHAPQYSWTYKHLGVTRSILAHGAVPAHGNVYDRWPGFFAVSAAFSRLTGVDPAALAPWCEPVLTLLDAVV